MDAINRAEKKLRQAEFFLAQLTALRVPGHTPEVKEFLLSACLTAAQSAFYVLHTDGGDLFNHEHKRWRQQTRTQEERAFLNRMIGLRDDDVHEGIMDAASVTKYVDAITLHGVSVFA